MLFGLLAGALFTGIVGTLGATFVWDIAHTDQVSPDLELPKWIVYLCIPLGSYLMCFRFLQVAWRVLRAPASCRTTTSRTSRASSDAIDSDRCPDLHPATPTAGGQPMSVAAPIAARARRAALAGAAADR